MKNSDKLVFVVRGSEDGNLGVFTNYKAAYLRAAAYFASGDTTCKQGYASSLKAFNQRLFVDLMSANNYSTVQIEGFYLNS